MRNALIIVVSVIVSALFLALALNGVPLAQVGESIAGANVAWLLAGVLTVWVALWTRAIRWRILLDERIPLVQTGHIFNISMLLNQIPLRVGEIARGLLATRYGVPLITAGASIVVERLIDLLIVVLLLAFSVSRLPNVPESVSQGAGAIGVVAVVGFVGLLIFARLPNLSHAVIDWLAARLPILGRLGLKKRLEELLDGLAPLTRPGQLFRVLLWSVIAWIPSVGQFWTLQHAFGVQGTDLFVSGMLMVSLAALSIALPATVAGLGPFQVAVNVAGDAIGIDPVTSTSIGLVVHAIVVINYALWGIIGLLALGVSFSDVLGRNRAPAPADTPVAQDASATETVAR